MQKIGKRETKHFCLELWCRNDTLCSRSWARSPELCTATGWHRACKVSSATEWDSQEKPTNGPEKPLKMQLSSHKKAFCLHRLSPHLHRQWQVGTGLWHPPEQKLVRRKKERKTKQKKPPQPRSGSAVTSNQNTHQCPIFPPNCHQRCSVIPALSPMVPMVVMGGSSSSVAFPLLGSSAEGPPAHGVGKLSQQSPPALPHSSVWHLLQYGLLFVLV